MEKNVRSKTHETNDPEHTGVLSLVADDRVLHLDGADLETGTHGKTESSAAFAKP
jgi:hypothetical protein